MGNGTLKLQLLALFAASCSAFGKNIFCFYQAGLINRICKMISISFCQILIRNFNQKRMHDKTFMNSMDVPYTLVIFLFDIKTVHPLNH